MLLREFVSVERLLAGLDQRAAAGVAVGGGGRGRGDADVAQPAAASRRCSTRRRRGASRSAPARRRRRRSSCSASRSRITRSAAAAAASARRCSLIAITGSLALPIAARGAGGALPLGARRVTLAPRRRRARRRASRCCCSTARRSSTCWPRVAAGRLPNFGRVLDSGASMDLATIRPTQPDPVWAAVATGMYPAKNGVRSAAFVFRARRRPAARPAAGSLFLAHPGPPRRACATSRTRRRRGGRGRSGRSSPTTASAPASSAGR